VSRYDGQTLYINDNPIYELGHFLGGGAAGMVYEAENKRTKEVGHTGCTCAKRILAYMCVQHRLWQ
jgi:hypothetical protein